MQYRIGTISVTNGSNVVNGVGTTWLANVLVNQVGKPNPTLLVNGGSVVYTIAAVNSNTQLLLSVPYAGSTASGLNYSITKDFTANLGLAEINEGDRDWAVHLTEEVIRKVDVAVATGGGGSVDVSGKEDKTNKDTDVTMAANSDVKYPSQKAVKTRLDRFNKSILDYGAKCDVTFYLDGTINSGSTSFSSASATFTSADIGKHIVIVEALSSYLNLETTIVSVTNSHTVVLAAPATRSVAGVEFCYGTDDGPVIQSIIDTYGKWRNIDNDILKYPTFLRILFPDSRICGIWTPVVIDTKSQIELTGGGTIFSPDIRTISIRYSRYINIVGLNFYGMQYDKMITSPTYSSAIYIDGVPAYVLYPTRNRSIKIEDNFIVGYKYGIGGQGGFTGVESILRGNKIKQQSILDSVGILVSTTDNKITGNVVNESRIGVQISGKDLTAFTHNHFYPGGAYGNLELYGSTTAGSNVFTVDTATTNINWLNHLYQSVGRWLQLSEGLPATYTYNGAPTSWYRVSAVSPVVPAWDQFKSGGYHAGDKVWLNSGWYQCTTNNNPAQPVTNTACWTSITTPAFTVTLKKADGTDATATSSTTAQAKAYIMKHNLYSTSGTRISNISFNEFDHADDYMVNIVDPGGGWTFSSNTLGLTGLYANAKFMQVDFTNPGGTLDSWSIVNNSITDGRSTTDYNREMIALGSNVDIANSRDLDIRGNGQEQGGDSQVSMRTIAHYRDDYLKDDTNNSQPMLALTGRFGGGKTSTLFSIENRDDSVFGVPFTLRKSRLGGAVNSGDFGGSVRFQYHDGVSFKTRAGLDSELLNTDGSSLLYMQTTRPSATNTTAALQLDEQQNVHLGGGLITTVNSGSGARYSILLGNNASAPSSGITDKVALYGADLNGAGTAGFVIKTEDNKVFQFGTTPSGTGILLPNGNLVTGSTPASGTVGSVQLSDGVAGFTSDTAFTYLNGSLSLGKSGSHVGAYRLWVTDDGGFEVASINYTGAAHFAGGVNTGAITGTTVTGTTINATSGFQVNGATLAQAHISGLTTADSPQFTGLVTVSSVNSPAASIVWKNSRASGAALTTATALGYISVSGTTSTNTYDTARGIFVANPSETWSDAVGATTGGFYLSFRTRSPQSGQSTMNGVTERLRISDAGFFGINLGAAVASATTITPTAPIFHVTGTTAISTINIPYTGFNGQITIIPDGIFTTTTAGNIALASTAVVSKALIMTYDATAAKWYPSY